MKRRAGLAELEAERLERARGYMRLLRRSINRLKAIGAEVLEPYDITEPQYLALLWISGHEGLIQGELVAELDSDPNTVSAILRILVKKKLIARKKHPTDGRAFRLFASKQGKELVGVIRPQMDRFTGKLPGLMPVGHEAAIVEWLERVGKMQKSS